MRSWSTSARYPGPMSSRSESAPPQMDRSPRMCSGSSCWRSAASRSPASASMVPRSTSCAHACPASITRRSSARWARRTSASSGSGTARTRASVPAATSSPRDSARWSAGSVAPPRRRRRCSTASFRSGRGRFLAALLDRPHIFRTEHFRGRYEQRAREQIAALLASPRYRGSGAAAGCAACCRSFRAGSPRQDGRARYSCYGYFCEYFSHPKNSDRSARGATRRRRPGCSGARGVAEPLHRADLAMRRAGPTTRLGHAAAR
jgi:hypothetical protein